MIRGLLAIIDLVAIIDRLCPIQENKARYTHGQVIALLVANRLTSPTPLIRVEQWARRWAVQEIFGVEPDALNDDRCGRALETLAEQADQVVGSIGAAAVAAFGIETLRFHWDMTSMSVYGAYDQADPAYATPKPGHPKDHRFDLNQVQVGVATSADGAVALLTRAYDGGAAEISQVKGALPALRELAGERRFLMVGDSKLVSYTNLRAIDAAGATFVAPASRTLVGLANSPPTTRPPPRSLPGRPSATRTSCSTSATFTGSSRGPRPYAGRRPPTRRSPCARCSPTRRGAPRRPRPPAPNRSTRHARRSSCCTATLGPATTPTRRRSAPASRRSPHSVGSGHGCARTSTPTDHT